MGITRDEFSQFKEWMQERHNEVMEKLDGLPCKAHQKEINKFGRALGIASGLGAVIGAIIGAAMDRVFK